MDGDRPVPAGQNLTQLEPIPVLSEHDQISHLLEYTTVKMEKVDVIW